MASMALQNASRANQGRDEGRLAARIIGAQLMVHPAVIPHSPMDAEQGTGVRVADACS